MTVPVEFGLGLWLGAGSCIMPDELMTTPGLCDCLPFWVAYTALCVYIPAEPGLGLWLGGGSVCTGSCMRPVELVTTPEDCWLPTWAATKPELTGTATGIAF
jgi:hypothetical protein